MIVNAIFVDDTFGPARGIYDPSDLKDASLLILHGGEDISPSLYGDPVVMAHAGEEPSERDEIEVGLAKEAIRRGIPIFGICRGHQLLAALAGGKLYQHVENHITNNHPLIFEGKELLTNSCHHQMVIPNDDMDVLGYTPCRSRIKYTTHPIVDEGDEPEIIHFKTINAIGVQGHPEWLPKKHPLVEISKYLIRTKLGVNV